MSRITHKRISAPKQLKAFRIGYFIEAGFAVTIMARSERAAERIVRKHLDEYGAKLPGSEGVHYEDGICVVSEVQS